MWWLIVKAVLQALAMIVIGELLRPKAKIQNPKPNSLGDFSFPTAVEGRTIPVGWGTFKVAGPNITWYGDLAVEPIKQKQKTGLFSSERVVIGYKYNLGIQHALCFGAIDEFIALKMDDKEVPLTGLVVTDDLISFNMNAPTLFGKPKEQGGVTGPVKVYRGTFNQPANEYLRTVLGEDEIPAYRPICHAIFEHCYMGNSGNLQPPEFILRRTPNPLGLTDGRHNIDGDANPANMVYEILTDRTWGMGISSALIDVADFVAVGNTLAAAGERLGLSMLVDNVQGGDELIAEIMRHIDGVLYQDFETGLFRIALVRDDYDAETAPVFDESNIVSGSLEFGRSSWEDTQNTVLIKYLDRAQNFTERVIQHQNLANISARGGQIEAEEYDFFGVSNPQAANVIAARVLKTVSSPLSKVDFDTNRSGTTLRPGSVLRLSWPALGIESIVYRVTEIDLGTLESPTVRVSAVEDIFSIASVAFTAPSGSGWTPPRQGPQPLAEQALLEAPRAFYGDARYVMTLAARAGSQELGYLVYADPLGGTAYTEIADVPTMTPTGLLLAPYGASTHSLDAVGFTIGSTYGMGDLEAVTAEQRAQGQNLVMIGNEFLAWTDILNNGDGTWTVTGIQQGVLDTVPARHLAGTRVWFVTEGFGLTSPEAYTSNVTVRAKLLPYTATETLAIGSAVSMLLTTADRATKPYPPAGITVNGLYFRDAVIAPGTAALTLAWNERNRLQQIEGSVVLQQDAAALGAEVGVSHTIKLYGENNTLLRTVAGYTAGTYTWDTEASDSGLAVFPGDLFGASVRLLMHFDGADGSTVFSDAVSHVFTAVGNAQIDTAQSKFGGASAYFDGAGDSINTPDSPDWNFGSGDFTVEFWVRRGAATLGHIIGKWGYTNRGWAFYINAAGAALFSYSTDTSNFFNVVTGGAIPTNTWAHVAVSRNGSTIRLFIDGVLVDSAAMSATIASPSRVLEIGHQNAAAYAPFNGWIDELRLTKGAGRYTAAFTPASAAFVGSSRLNQSGRVVIETYRGGVLAHQNHDFNWTRPDAAPPIYYLNTEASDILTTEGDDALIAE